VGDGGGEEFEDFGDGEVGVVNEEDGDVGARGEFDLLLDEDGGGLGFGEVV
jgi:hypothetical protein